MILAALTMLLMGCNAGYYPAPAGSQLVVDDGILVVGSEAFYTDNGTGALALCTALVTDANGVPLSNIEIEVATNYAGNLLLPESAVKLVDFPTPDPSVEKDPDAARATCDVDSDGYIDDDAPEWCSWWWDTETAQFYEFGVDYAATEEDYRPTYMQSGTDSRGILRYYLYIDSMPLTISKGGDVTWSSTSVWTSIGVASATFSVDVAQ
jgi:hypothetical protein